MRPIALIVPLFLASTIAGATATESERYRLERTPNGYVRMDTQSGEMSLCEESAGQLVCRKATEGAAVPSAVAQVEDLQLQLKALEKRVSELEGSLAAKIEKSLPTEEDFNKTLGYMERFFRSFMGIVKEFEGESPKPNSDKPTTDRT